MWRFRKFHQNFPLGTFTKTSLISSILLSQQILHSIPSSPIHNFIKIIKTFLHDSTIILVKLTALFDIDISCVDFFFKSREDISDFLFNISDFFQIEQEKKKWNIAQHLTDVWEKPFSIFLKGNFQRKILWKEKILSRSRIEYLWMHFMIL